MRKPLWLIVAAMTAFVGTALPATAAQSPATANAGSQLWTARYNGAGNSISNDDLACCDAVSPDGKTVFVTGVTNQKLSTDYATIAYNAATGVKLWMKLYDGPSMQGDSPSAIAMSPDGSTVYVTGTSTGKISGADYLTVAYNASTGATLWTKRYNGPVSGSDQATSLAVGPGGQTIFVTGSSANAGTESDYATVAYRASTGAQLWVKRYDSPGKSGSQATSMTVSPGGGTVFVTGYSTGVSSDWDFATVAYNAATGAQLWVQRYNGSLNSTDEALSIAMAPAGNQVFVTGWVNAASGDYLTLAYNATTGASMWKRTYNDSVDGLDIPIKAAVSPNGNEVLVTGYTYDAVRNEDVTTIAYNSATGATLWTRHYLASGSNPSESRDMAFSKDGSTVYVVGMVYGSSNWDYLTVAYDVSTGAVRWQRRYDGPYHNSDTAASVAVNPVNGNLYVTGQSMGLSGSADFFTIAYSG